MKQIRWNNIRTKIKMIHIKLQAHKKKSILIEILSIQCKLQNGSLWCVRHLSVTTQTRLLRQRSVSMALHKKLLLTEQYAGIMSFPSSLALIHFCTQSTDRPAGTRLTCVLWNPLLRQKPSNQTQVLTHSTSSLIVPLVVKWQGMWVQ